MGQTPATGATIAIGKIWAAFDNNSTRSYPPAANTTIALRGQLGSERNRATSPPGGATAAQITAGTASLSNFWNLGTPDTYP